MKLIINKNTINIFPLNGLINKFKGLKFVLKPIKDGYRFKSRYANTYLLCQRVDIIMTDKDNNILFIYNNVKSETFIFPKRKVYYTYFLPANTCKDLKTGEILNIKD